MSIRYIHEILGASGGIIKTVLAKVRRGSAGAAERIKTGRFPKVVFLRNALRGTHCEAEILRRLMGNPKSTCSENATGRRRSKKKKGKKKNPCRRISVRSSKRGIPPFSVEGVVRRR